MNILVETRTVERERYAVAVPTNGPMIIIQTYHNIEQLETGYTHWYQFASKNSWVKPVPIKLLDDAGKCKILEDLLIQGEGS